MSVWPHPACRDPVELLRECTQRRERDSGPGGQHRNKVETAVVLTHGPTGVRARAAERRDAARNREVALRRLRLTLAVTVRTDLEAAQGGVKAGPSALWISRCGGGKIICSERHVDFPALLAELLDVVAASEWDARAAAEHLGCSASQVIRFAARHPPALVLWNAQRAERGLHPLR